MFAKVLKANPKGINQYTKGGATAKEKALVAHYATNSPEDLKSTMSKDDIKRHTASFEKRNSGKKFSEMTATQNEAEAVFGYKPLSHGNTWVSPETGEIYTKHPTGPSKKSALASDLGLM